MTAISACSEVYATGYREGTLREKLFGEGPYLPASHPAARYRNIEQVKREEAQRRAKTDLLSPV